MNTLREIGEFVGLGDATPPPLPPGKPIRAQITMRAVGGNVPVLSSSERTSMQAMILGLQNLPAISLEAEAEHTRDLVPFNPVLHIHPSAGVILETNVAIIWKYDPQKQLVGKSEQGNGPVSVSSLTVNTAGIFVCEVTRIGIPNTGITTLTKTFDIWADKPSPVDRYHAHK